MTPFMIASVEPLPGRLRSRRIAFEPAIEVIEIELFAPEQPRQRLAHYVLAVGSDALGNNGSIKLVCFMPSLSDLLVEAAIQNLRTRRRSGRKPEPHCRRVAGRHLQIIMRRGFGAVAVWING